MAKNKLVFEKTNYLLLGASVILVILGFVLMTGSSTTMSEFNQDIFSVRRIRVAPMVCLAGFLLMIFAILYRSRKSE